jgi:homoserine kinase
MASPREIVVPGSISNLGPGFDTLAVAVSLTLRVRVLGQLADARLESRFLSEPPGVDDRIARAFALASDRFGAPPHGWRIEVRSDIPMRAGLGSSGAAAVAGLRLYEAAATGDVGGRPPRSFTADDWLQLATEIEGHPDNASASLLGGFVTGCRRDDGRVVATSRPWPDDLVFVVATPHEGLDTQRSRAVLPRCIEFQDAVFNLQRAALFLRAVETRRYDLLREAMRDRWHQPHRASLVPGLAEALALDQPGLLGVCLSGSGPSVVAVAKRRAASAIRSSLAVLYDRLAIAATVRTLRAAPTHRTRTRRTRRTCRTRRT